MPKNMFKTGGDGVSNVFVSVGLMKTDNFTTFFEGDNSATYTKFIDRQITAFNQLNE